MLKFILDRLKERSTWLGVIGLATAAGVGLTPDQAAAIATGGAAIASAVAAFTPDSPSKKD